MAPRGLSPLKALLSAVTLKAPSNLTSATARSKNGPAAPVICALGFVVSEFDTPSDPTAPT